MRKSLGPVLGLILFLLTPSLLALADNGEERAVCLAALQETFQKLPREQVNEFLKIQGEITLNRLSWAYLKKSGESGKLEKIETTILQLLDEKYSRTDEEFIAAREAFEARPLTRESLSKISPYLSEVLKAQNKDQKNSEEDPFLVNTSDIKMLEVLAQFESSDNLSANNSSAASILNFSKLINSSYAGLAVSEIPTNIEFIEDHLQDLNTDLIHLLNDIPAPAACLSLSNGAVVPEDGQECVDEVDLKFADLFKQNEDIQKMMLEVLQAEFLSDHKLYYGLKYGEIWQKVKKKNKAPLTSLTGSKKNSTKTIVKKEKTKTKVSADPSDSWFQDPVHLIVNAKKGRQAKDWKSFDRDYLEAFAKAIYDNEKVFLVKDRLYDSQTGKMIDPQGAINKVPGLSSLVKGKTAHEKAIIAEAILNNKKGFQLGNKLYNNKGQEVDPLAIIVEHRKKELKINRSPADYKGMERPYLLAMANAIMNKKPTFWVEKKQYDTLTGRDKLSPFLSQKKYENYDEYESEKRKSFKLSQIDLIRKYHLDHDAKIKCNKYAIVDKNNNKIQIYKSSGEKIFDVEVLLGAIKSDQKTKFLNYDLKTSNRTTGAGIYTLGEIRNQNPYYTENYGGNLYSLNNQDGTEEKALAIHQVPINLSSRNKLLNDGNPNNNRATGGCINLKKQDFEKLRNLMGPGCQVYVLPEEEGNRIVLKNDKLNFTTDKKIAGSDLGNYNFSSKDKSYRPIKIDINAQLYKDFEKDILKKRLTDPKPFVTTFSRTLEDEKKTIMSLYNLDNDDYNELSKLAFGIMGQESAFGTHAKLWTKETHQGVISSLKCAKEALRTLKKLSTKLKCDDKNSRGLTQIKQIPDKIKKQYPTVTENRLIRPRESAIATVGFLAEILVELKSIVAQNKNSGSGVQVSRADMMDYMIYLYNGSRYKLKTDDKSKQATPEDNIYFKNTKKYSRYITLREYR